MKKNYFLFLLIAFASVILAVACSDDDDKDEYVPVSPVVLDPAQVPYPKLSDYKFFEGDIRLQSPAYKVLPYKPASELFSDYAHKKRFVWMPAGKNATWNGAGNALEFPVGAVLIKTFYFDNVQPSNSTRILETRLLIKKSEATPTSSGWHAYNYIWNAEQTEAFLDEAGNGISVPLSWIENGNPKTTTYRIPSATECMTCHKLNPTQTSDGEIMIPIGVKPQNLNYIYNYGSTQENQLQKWISEGYLQSNIPSDIYSTVDWKDTSKPLDLRARSYLDINCAHCHRDGAHCDYVDMRFNFSNTNEALLGVCMVPVQIIENKPYVITAGDAYNSELHVRISSQEESVMMPIIGRTLVHEEGVNLLEQWINSLEQRCD